MNSLLRKECISIFRTCHTYQYFGHDFATNETTTFELKYFAEVSLQFKIVPISFIHSFNVWHSNQHTVLSGHAYYYIRPSSPFAMTISEKWLRTFQALLWTQTGIQVIFLQTLLHSPDKLSHKIVKLEVNLFGNNTLSFAFLLQSNGVPLHWMSNCLNIIENFIWCVYLFHLCANINRLVSLSVYSKLCFFGR